MASRASKKSSASDEDEFSNFEDKQKRIHLLSPKRKKYLHNYNEVNSTSNANACDVNNISSSTKNQGDAFNYYTSSDCSDSSPTSVQADYTAQIDRPGQYSKKAERIMSKMGYVSGKGLGMEGQGRLDPVGLSSQRGRRGLGLVIKGLEEGTVEWDPEQEVVKVQEEFEWFPSCETPCPKIDELMSWTTEGPRKETIHDERLFCDPLILENILNSKQVFDDLEPHELRKSRARSNPFETIHGMFYLNRAAMKMANLDALLGFMFTSPRHNDGTYVLRDPSKDLLYFADVCAGPGGFSEYILWRKKWHAKGFGFTIRGTCDFKLDDFYAGTVETFEPHYGENGYEGDGDIFKKSNVDAFTNFVLENTQLKGVHFMMADGGFSVEGKENIQEIMSKQLYLCQMLVALKIVRIGGNFLCKLFDIFTPFSVGLVYLMYRCFEFITIIKPNTSRPANSERYLVCKGKRNDCSDVALYLEQLNERLNQFGFDLEGNTKSPTDIQEVVPLRLIFEDEAFQECLVDSNNRIGKLQIIGLAKIVAFCRDNSLVETRQSQLKVKCLEFWQVPNRVRRAPSRVTPEGKMFELFGTMDTSFLFLSANRLGNLNILHQLIKSVYDWKIMLLATCDEFDCCFFLGLGRTRIYQYEIASRSWTKLDLNKLRFELPAGSLIYAEIVQEMRGELYSMRRSNTIHIIDAIFLGGDDLRKVDIVTRNERIRSFVTAVNKPSRPNFTVLRAKEIWGLEHMSSVIIDRLRLRTIKGSGRIPRLTFDVSSATEFGPSVYICPRGVLMFRIVTGNYMIAYSKTNKRKYWFNSETGSSEFSCPSASFPDYLNSFRSRLFWKWDTSLMRFHADQYINEVALSSTTEDVLHPSEFVDFIRKGLGY